PRQDRGHFARLLEPRQGGPAQCLGGDPAALILEPKHSHQLDPGLHPGSLGLGERFPALLPFLVRLPEASGIELDNPLGPSVEEGLGVLTDFGGGLIFHPQAHTSTRKFMESQPPKAYRYYDFIMATFVTVLLCSNLIGVSKVCHVWGITFGAGTLFFP